MYIMMINLNLRMQDYLSSEFLSRGVRIYLGKEEQGAIDLIVKESVQNNRMGYLILRLGSVNDPWLRFLIRLKKMKGLKYKLVILSNQKSRNFVQILLLLETALLIKDSLNEIEIYRRFEKFLKKNGDRAEKRKSLRIVPRDFDEIYVHLAIPNSDLIIKGKVINLSMVGLALELEEEGKNYGIYEDQFIENAQLFLNQKKGTTGLKVIVLKKNIIGVKLIRASNYLINILGRYVVERISEPIGN